MKRWQTKKALPDLVAGLLAREEFTPGCRLNVTHLQANSCASLLDCLHGIFYLMYAPLWTPCDDVLIILQAANARDA